MEREQRPSGGEATPRRQHADESGTTLPLGEDVFVVPGEDPRPPAPPADPEPAHGSRILWEMVEEEMHLRGLTLAEISRGSGVPRQTLARYRDGGSGFVSEHVLRRLVGYFGQLPWEGGDPRADIVRREPVRREERTLRRMPIAVDDADGRRASVIPDGWLDVRVALPDGIDRYCVALEIDRGTTAQRTFRRKVARWIAAADGPYQRAFGTDLLTVAVVATPGAARADQLRGWIAAELARLRRGGAADLFLVTAADAAAVDPATFYGGPVWRRCDDAAPVPLIEGIGPIPPEPS